MEKTEEEKALEERRKKRRRIYWENNKVRICRQIMDEYIPKVIETARMKAPELMIKYYEKFPFDHYAEPHIKRNLRVNKIWEHNLAYQECYEAGILAYMYSISRCVYSKIENVEGYIRKMIRISFVWGITIFNEGRNICRQNGFSRVYVDSPENSRRY